MSESSVFDDDAANTLIAAKNALDCFWATEIDFLFGKVSEEITN